MADAYLLLKTGAENRLHTMRWAGDVIFARRVAGYGSTWQFTAKERTEFYVLRVNSIADPKLTTVLSRLMGPEEDDAKDQIVHRRVGVSDGDGTGPGVRAFLISVRPAWASHLQTYFNHTTEQPGSDIKALPWLTIKPWFWSKLRSDVATDEELGDN